MESIGNTDPISEKSKIENKLCYTVTNERIEAVIDGLNMNNPNHPDKILAVGGSGDIVFALLPYVSHIDVVDTNPAQILLIRKRVEALKKGDYETFLNPGDKGKLDGEGDDFNASKTARDKYFLQEGVLDSIRTNIDKINILDACDLFSAANSSDQKYSGIYLSNILGLIGSESSIRDNLQAVQSKLEKNGLIYAANGAQIDTLSTTEAISGIRATRHAIPSTLELDEKLTQEARKYGEYKGGLPSIYKTATFF